jgi:hypothetical protein
MTARLFAFLSIVAVARQGWCDSEAPWTVNRPIVKIQRELYQSAPRAGAAAYLSVACLGPGVQREEILTEEVRSDEFQKPRRRRSNDNGRTWSALEPVTDIWAFPKDDFIWWAPSPQFFFYDAQTRLTLAMWLRQNVVGGRYYNHTFARLSNDLGLTWGNPKLLRYEEGDDFDPREPLKKRYLEHNSAYVGQRWSDAQPRGGLEIRRWHRLLLFFELPPARASQRQRQALLVRQPLRGACLGQRSSLPVGDRRGGRNDPCAEKGHRYGRRRLQAG